MVFEEVVRGIESGPPVIVMLIKIKGIVSSGHIGIVGVNIFLAGFLTIIGVLQTKPVGT